MLNSLQNGKGSLIFTNLLVHINNLTNSIRNPIRQFSKFWPPYFPLLVHKTILTIPINIPFLHTSAIFHLRFLSCSHPSCPCTKTFSIPQPWESLEDWICFKHCFFLEFWTEKKQDSQSLIPYCSELGNWYIAGSNLWWRCLQSEWQTIQSTLSHTVVLLPLLPYPISAIKGYKIFWKTSCLTWFSF